MEFGLDKCAKATFKNGKLTETSIKLDINTTIKELEQEESYKYLGINEGDGIQHSQMKEKIQEGVLQESQACPKKWTQCSQSHSSNYHSCSTCSYV